MELWTAIWQSVVLGTVQGLTEFLPVSSSGHLSLLHKIMGAEFGGNEMFVDLVMHLGTLIAVFAVMWNQIWSLFKKPFDRMFMLIVATVPAGLVGVLFDDLIDSVFNGEGGMLWLGVCFIVTAIMLFVCEVVSKRQKELRPFGWKNATAMGLMQTVALFPGISRSGSTIVAGVLSGGKREEVANFSFMMSIPIILGGLALKSLDLIQNPSAVSAVGTNGFIGLLFGVVFSAVSGYFAIKFMLKLIAKANYKWFSLYLSILGIVCISLSVAGVF